MIRTAQNVADKYGLSRQEIDAFALRSHQHAAAARDSGRLAEEIHPVEIPATRTEAASLSSTTSSFETDTTADKLAKLPPQSGTTQMTAGNSSPLTDGASAVVLASATHADQTRRGAVGPGGVVGRLRPRPEIHGHRSRLGHSAALERAHVAPEDIDVWEVHEAFSRSGARRAPGVAQPVAWL